VLVATSRVVPLLAQAGVRLDALVGSTADPGEIYNPGDIDPPPRLVVKTSGADGGTYQVEGAEPRSYPAATLNGPIADTYGAGDSFAAGLTFALGAGYPVEEAIGLATRCGAAVITGRGPYRGQLLAKDLNQKPLNL
ncbi:MAG: PfkB family carbohydrate kinase, partial [Actinomycetota bacterium]